MSSELRDLYQETILDHGKRPRRLGEMPDADGSADGHNPLCGDRLTIYVKTDGKTIQKLTFEGNGCAISMASASLMAEALEGQPVERAAELFGAFQHLVTGRPGEDTVDLGKLRVFEGVSEFPVRVKCATLAWHTLQAALAGETEDAVTTE